MTPKWIIAIIEPSEIISEGIASYWTRTGYSVEIKKFSTLEHFIQKHQTIHHTIVFINPIKIQNLEDHWIKFKEKHNELISIAIVYQHYSQSTLSLFTHTFHIDDSFQELIKLIIHQHNQHQTKIQKETLSTREKEILRFLSQGKSVKEIADKLHLSHHTVLTHRKNISAKTGIKTLAGLTVSAISLGIINIDEMNL